jgi:hypothetical protein
MRFAFNTMHWWHSKLHSEFCAQTLSHTWYIECSNAACDLGDPENAELGGGGGAIAVFHIGQTRRAWNVLHSGGTHSPAREKGFEPAGTGSMVVDANDDESRICSPKIVKRCQNVVEIWDE